MQESIESTRTELEERLRFETLLDDLIAMKKAAGRPKDREDLDALLRFKKSIEAR